MMRQRKQFDVIFIRLLYNLKNIRNGERHIKDIMFRQIQEIK